MKIKPVIIAGGQGVRLWPLSRPFRPKQFVNIFGGLSLLQKTLIRNQSFGKPSIIIGEEHRSITYKQIQKLNIEAELIIEPMQKNTAICALIAAITAKNDGFDTVILLPADHYIYDEPEYLLTINKALDYTKKFGISTIGIPASSPNPEYGYIKVGNNIEEDIFHTTSFIEKPSIELAKDYLKQGGYFWNSGIFIYNVDFMLSIAKQVQPDLLEKAQKSLLGKTINKNLIKLRATPYAEALFSSFDQAIIQYIPEMIMVKSSFKWSDLGSWQSLWKLKNKDKTNNYCKGNIALSNTTNSYISTGKKFTAVIGLNNIVVIDTPHALLVANKSETCEIKNILNQLK